jgi:hypothetical protein
VVITPSVLLLKVAKWQNKIAGSVVQVEVQ